MNELWVARDAYGWIAIYCEKPEWVGRGFLGKCVGELDRERFPDLRPGECKRLVLAEETI